MVQLTNPTVERDRAAYLKEIGKFKDMVKDCDKDRFPNAGGRSGDNEIGIDEGIECLQKYVRKKVEFWVKNSILKKRIFLKFFVLKKVPSNLIFAEKI